MTTFEDMNLYNVGSKLTPSSSTLQKSEFLDLILSVLTYITSSPIVDLILSVLTYITSSPIVDLVFIGLDIKRFNIYY
jgi:hypothetical protein